MNLGNLIENAVRTMAREEAKEEDSETTEIEDLTMDQIENEVLSDNDFLQHYEFIEEQ